MVEAFNKIGINGFVFISAFFLSKRGNKSNIKKIVSFILQLNFIGILVLLLSVVTIKNISINLAIKSILPIFTQHFWYPFNYLLLLVFSPYLNTMLENMKKGQVASLLILLIGFNCIFLKINFFYLSSVFLGHQSHSLIWFFVLYLTAFYYGKYGSEKAKYGAKIMFPISIFLLFLAIIMQKYIPIIEKIKILDNDSLLAFIATYSSFVVFQNIKLKTNKTISNIMIYISPAAFIVYIFQEHDAVRSYLWKYVNVLQYLNSPTYKLALVTVAVFLALMIISIAIYLVYKGAKKLYLEKVENVLVSYLSNFVTALSRKFYFDS